MHTRKRLTIVYLAMAAALLVLFALNLFWGSVALSPADVVNALLGRGQDVLTSNILLQLRLPRAVMVVLLGAALSVAGYLLQTFFANPIAGHFQRGQAGRGADHGCVFKPRPINELPHLDFGCFRRGYGCHAVCAGCGTPRAAHEHFGHLRRHDRLHLLRHHRYCGGLCPGFNLHNWSMGSFSGMTWGNVGTAAAITLPCLAAAFLLSKPMAAYQMGESYAASVGVSVRSFSVLLVLLSSLLAACVTAFAGPISFVGIAVPHLVKQALGSAKPLHVLPGCALGGASFCLLCDLIARSLFAPTELSISSVTAVFGAPVVIWLLVRHHSGEGTT